MHLNLFHQFMTGMILLTASVVACADDGSPVIHYFNATLTDQNKITLEWQVTGANAQNRPYIYKRGRGDDIGFVSADCADECTTSLRVKRSGRVYRYTLKTGNGAGKSFATTQVKVPALPPPAVSGHRVVLGMFDVQPQKLAWTHSGPGYVLITPPGSLLHSKKHYPATGSITVDQLELGNTSYGLAYCEETAPGETPLCSTRISITFNVGPAQFAGAYREFVNADQPLTVTWSNVGSYWRLTVPSLDIDKRLSEPQYTFDAGQLTAGVHEIYLASCQQDSGCSNRRTILSAVAGTASFQVEDGSLIRKGQTLARLAIGADGSARKIPAPRTGRVDYAVSDNSHVQPGRTIAYIINNGAQYTAHHQIVAGMPETVPTWDVRPWTQDFTATTYDASSRQSLGAPLDVTFDGKEHVWVLGEFSTAVGKGHGGKLSVHEVPLRHYLDESRVKRVKPFTLSFFGADKRSSITALAENIIWNGERIWFTQGGMLGEYASNHSRVVRFDPAAKDNPATLLDERFCAIHVPGNNNALIGVAWDTQRQRIWMAMTKGPSGHAAIAWFKPDAFNGSCNNRLDYRDAAVVQAASEANRCSSHSESNCIHFLPLPVLPDGSTPLPAHLAVGSQDFVWFTDFTGLVLGRYSVDTNDFDYFPMPESPNKTALFGGFPWQIGVGENAVYIGEYGDVVLVRFDKNYSTPEDCMIPLAGDNPCMSQLHLPRVWRGINLHSIALHGDRLWFTLANEPRNPEKPMASTFGYVDVASWASGDPHGVIYTGLSALGSLPAAAHQSLRGIAISPRGNIALADMYAGVIILEPKP